MSHADLTPIASETPPGKPLEKHGQFESEFPSLPFHPEAAFECAPDIELDGQLKDKLTTADKKSLETHASSLLETDYPPLGSAPVRRTATGPSRIHRHDRTQGSSGKTKQRRKEKVVILEWGF
eukprot:TRINITY_DN3329_c0_g1_i2.p1 TRINITY_DN3329_c0_g1~~TRINITY_DN3329_c0_g1_i2.p1  ORF type:complete len:123 (-),score=16.83 TRINITY_DN3329_c0_g1_i2:110-478(-)